MLQHLSRFYETIDIIGPREKAAKMMREYDPVETVSHLIDHLKKEWGFSRQGGHTISDSMMVSKCITLMAQMATFNDEIREWIR